MCGNRDSIGRRLFSAVGAVAHAHLVLPGRRLGRDGGARTPPLPAAVASKPDVELHGGRHLALMFLPKYYDTGLAFYQELPIGVGSLSVWATVGHCDYSVARAKLLCRQTW